VEAGLTLAAARCEGQSGDVGAEAVADLDGAGALGSDGAGLRLERR
jgi:hypothetical protein